MVTSTQTKLAKKARTASSIRGYDSALSFLRSHTDYEQMVRIRYNTDTFNLDRMRLLLKKMGNPHEKIKTVHIAGTKGKGSTAMMLSTMLQSCGYTVGLYMSHHITDLRERIKIDEHKINQKSLGSYISKIAPFVV
jgi:dihydrofolate synthase/folylpolyglutamate synthase